MAATLTRHWHHGAEEEILSLLGSSGEQGLDPREVHRRQQRFGPNQVTTKRGDSPLLLFLQQFHQPLIYILLASATVTTLLREWVDASVIFGVVLVNAIFGFLQELKAVQAIESLSRILTTQTEVLRGGERLQIPSTDLVSGDIVFLHSGDRVPADIRLLQARDLHLDESALTGESLPVHKSPGVLPGETLLSDRTNMLYSMTLVTYGTATGVVVTIGDQTEIGRINELIAAVDPLETPLTRKISRFSRQLLYAILALALFTFVVGMLRGEGWINMFMAAVALAVGAIPEGLPAAVTITLAIGVSKMARRNAIIRKLPAVETLGGTTVICSDKTGTLTQNQMTVQQIAVAGNLFHLSGVGYLPHGLFRLQGEVVSPEDHPALRECLLAGLLCNESRVVSRGDDWFVEGDPTEGALVVAAIKGGLDRERLAAQFPRRDAIPFESQYQYMATLHDRPDGSGVLYLKGSVESILDRCDQEISETGETLPLDRDWWERQVAEMASRGVRLLALARAEQPITGGPLTHADVARGLIFLGLQGMIDPPRPQVFAAVRACQSAGIRVKMITGDHVITAMAIAREIGIVPSDAQKSLALDGREIAALSDQELQLAVEEAAVFARVAPEQKLRLVKALQKRGHIVAMTGDGVNDAPALRRADIGVAMGITGTEVAKEAAAMVLTDDNFSSIEAAVEEGRGVFDNLVKFITWTLPTNIGEGLVILTAIVSGVELPILPVQILWINMTTAILLGLMLAFEPKEPGIMERPPRNSDAPLLTNELLLRILLVGVLLLLASFGLFEWELSQGETVAAARTTTVNVFVFGEIFYLFNCRSLHHSMFRVGLFSNPWILYGVGGMVLLQLLYTYLPVMHAAFGSAPIGLEDWLLILGCGLGIYLIIGVEKWLRSTRATIKGVEG